MAKLSVVLAVRNEEKNLARCLDSVKDIADEIVVVDEQSTDKTIEIAKRYGARVYVEPHERIFHVTKQKAIDRATGEWILQLDADEVVTPGLASEIKRVIDGVQPEVDKNKLRLFERHQKAIEARDGKIGKNTGEVVAYFIPRLNLFLGKPLRHAGVYPDPAIRLVRRGKAHFSGKSVHDILRIDGEVGWLFNDMEHYDSPTLERYVSRLNRYTDLHADELKARRAPKNVVYLLYYSLVKSFLVFMKLYFRHRGYKDGMRGFLWSAFSAWHYPIAYFKYLSGERNG